VSPENPNYFGAKCMAFASFYAISGPKKVSTYRAHPLEWPL
jgi:hypothetical protein